jgi:hypothetical protein
MEEGQSCKVPPLSQPCLADNLACSVTFIQSQQIVLPLTVSVCPEIKGLVSVASHNADVRFLPGGTIYREEGFFLRINLLDCQLASYTPMSGNIDDVGDSSPSISTRSICCTA